MSTAKDQIHGWKEIAAYLERDERTAKRWEKQRGLPVRRIPGAGRANVYIVVLELEAWLAAGSGIAGADDALTGQPVEEQEIIPAADRASTASDETQSAPAFAGPEPPVAAGLSVAAGQVPAATIEKRRSWAWGFLAASTVAVALLLWVRAARPAHTAAAATIPAHLHAYRSPVRGVDEVYLQGVYFFEERTPAAMTRAIDSFSEAIARDPRDAPAYTGLAETYLRQREYATRNSREAYQLARDAAEKALALDPQLPDAHATLGFIEFFSEFDAKDATEQFRTAIRLDANCVLAHHWYGSMLTHQGRYAEALEELRLAQQLEPTSNAVISSLAYALGLNGNRDEAIAMLDRVMAVDPGAPSPPRISAHLSMQLPHDVPRFLAQSQRFAKLRHDTEKTRLLDRMTEAYHHGGEPAMWQAVIDTAAGTPWAASSDELIEAEAQLGHKEQAMQMLLQLATRRDTRLLHLRINPLFANLRSDPRYQQMLVDLNLAGAPPASKIAPRIGNG